MSSSGGANGTKNGGVEKPSSRKRKRSSPFRIKVGCVVALRSRPDLSSTSVLIGENVITWDDDWVYCWTKPFPTRDEGLALIGKRIRCFYPKTHKRRVLEGEITRLVNYGDDERGMLVELLIDKAQYEHFSFLPRADSDPDKLANETAKRNYRLEETIRGKNKVCVHVNLMKPWLMERGNEQLKEDKYLRWAIQKLVPARLFHKPTSKQQPTPKQNDDPSTQQPADGSNAEQPAHPPAESSAITEHPAEGNGNSTGEKKKRSSASDISSTATKKRRKTPGPISTSVRHMGDGNDDPEQQTNNWRWVASRFHDILLSSWEGTDVDDSFSAEILSGGFVAEVIKVESASASAGTLALVTLRRMFLPEHTSRGRLPHHNSFDILSDHDCISSNDDIVLQIPIEHLVVVSQKLDRGHCNSERPTTNGDNALEKLVVPHSYSLLKDAYFPLVEATEAKREIPAQLLSLEGDKYCHRCRRTMESEENGNCSDSKQHLSRRKLDASTEVWWCESCTATDELQNDTNRSIDDVRCECRECRLSRGLELESNLNALVVDARCDPSDSLFASSSSVIRSADVIDFCLPDDFLTVATFPMPLNKPTTKVKTRQPRKAKRPPGIKPVRNAGKKQNDERNGSQHKAAAANGDSRRKPTEDFSVFKPTCARLLSYDPKKKCESAECDAFSFVSMDKPRNLREEMFDNNVGETDRDEKTTSGRAARANQRRVMKDVASFGATTSLTIDTLASREPQLRFDRSGIHAWGVFADEDIAAGEMIVEYRGELIGNAIAEKREKEYETAKIGSDYMFRVDAFNVCDATKQGNVARFINASCEPNCYTKIITLDGNKRIVIYAKLNISGGEEVCYDYKFPLEFDKSKRIPCHCGSKECRGFMNWVSFSRRSEYLTKAILTFHNFRLTG
jgi:hypothetical protein